MGTVALSFAPEAKRPVAGDSSAIHTTVMGGPTSEAVIPARMQVDQPSGVERGARAKGLVLLATLGVALLAEGPIRRRAPRPTQSPPPVLLRTLSAPRRGPPRLQFA